jgi:hypothetical protein
MELKGRKRGSIITRLIVKGVDIHRITANYSKMRRYSKEICPNSLDLMLDLINDGKKGVLKR